MLLWYLRHYGIKIVRARCEKGARARVEETIGRKREEVSRIIGEDVSLSSFTVAEVVRSLYVRQHRSLGEGGTRRDSLAPLVLVATKRRLFIVKIVSVYVTPLGTALCKAKCRLPPHCSFPCFFFPFAPCTFPAIVE